MRVSIEHLSKTLRRKTILHDINADLADGTIYGLVGPNGSGKTMLLRAICGFIRPSAGSVRIDGKLVEFNHRLPCPIGLIIENPGFMPYASGWDNLRYLAELNNCFDAKETERLLEKFGLLHHAQEKVRSYSLGMRQKLAIVQALMEHQPLILLDEPTNGLDEESVQAFLDEMQRQRDEGHTIVIASHHDAELAHITDHTFHMTDGRLTV